MKYINMSKVYWFYILIILEIKIALISYSTPEGWAV